jgi:GST-like protein
MFTVYGAKGSGSVIVEAALTLCGLPYKVVEASSWGSQAERETAARVNPLGQVPVVVLPSGEVMTESAAILLWLSEQPEGRAFAPQPGDPARAAFLRWMAFIPANVYATYAVKDVAARWVSDEAAQAELVERAIARITFFWTVMEAEVDPHPFLFGETLGFLDLYVAVVSTWTPWRDAFTAACPKLGAMVKRVDADPRLERVWRERLR